VLVPTIDERLKQITREGCSEHQAEIEELEVMPDHVPLLVNVDSPIWHSSPDEAGERPFVSFFAPGISCREPKIADLVDELVCWKSRRGERRSLW
jgi:hypothetical protein